MLHEFIAENRDEIIKRCREQVATRSAPTPSTIEIDHGVPMFLDELIEELRHGDSPNRNIVKTATKHGHDLLHQGFTLSQVVHDYGDICQSTTELALERQAPISTIDFRTLNRCLDEAIASAVTQYGDERDHAIEEQATDEGKRLARLARELRTSIHVANVAHDVIKSGSVGISGSTGRVLSVNLLGASRLIDQLLDELAAGRRATDPIALKGQSERGPA